MNIFIWNLCLALHKAKIKYMETAVKIFAKSRFWKLWNDVEWTHTHNFFSDILENINFLLNIMNEDASITMILQQNNCTARFKFPNTFWSFEAAQLLAYFCCIEYMKV